jgi:hypothetical protein
MKLRISKLQDNKIKPLKKRIRQLIEKIRLAEQQVDNMHKDIQYLESIKVQNNSITNDKQFKFEKPSYLLLLDIRNRNAKIDTTMPEISTNLKSLNAHITNAKKSQEQEKIDNLQYVYSQLKKYKSVLEDIRKSPFYEKGSGIFSDPNEMVERLNLLIASKNAGNDSTDVYNECVEILDKLLNLKLIKKSDHKRIFSTQLAFLN